MSVCSNATSQAVPTQRVPRVSTSLNGIKLIHDIQHRRVYPITPPQSNVYARGFTGLLVHLLYSQDDQQITRSKSWSNTTHISCRGQNKIPLNARYMNSESPSFIQVVGAWKLNRKVDTSPTLFCPNFRWCFVNVYIRIAARLPRHATQVPVLDTT